jgi:hypothetical protein
LSGGGTCEAPGWALKGYLLPSYPMTASGMTHRLNLGSALPPRSIPSTSRVRQSRWSPSPPNKPGGAPQNCPHLDGLRHLRLPGSDCGTCVLAATKCQVQGPGAQHDDRTGRSWKACGPASPEPVNRDPRPTQPTSSIFESDHERFGTSWASSVVGHVGMTSADHRPGMCKLLLPDQSRIAKSSCGSLCTTALSWPDRGRPT